MKFSDFFKKKKDVSSVDNTSATLPEEQPDAILAEQTEEPAVVSAEVQTAAAEPVARQSEPSEEQTAAVADVPAAEESADEDEEEPNIFKRALNAVKQYFVGKWESLKDWGYRHFVAPFKKEEGKERRTFKQWIKDVGIWFKTLPSRIVSWAKSLTKDDVKAFFLGTSEKKGFIKLFVSYSLLILFGFVYVYPMLYMLGYSLMSPSDVSNPMVNYLPTSWYTQNFTEASQVLNFWQTLLETIYVSVLPAFFQTVACCLVAYGLARFSFRGKKVIFGLILLTFIVPTQLTMLPQLLIYTTLKLTDTVFSFIIPAVLGQGIKSAVFILIFYQFFRGIPDSVVEAAKIDGANSFQVFYKIGIPAAVPAILLSFLLSVVWYYNETVLSSIYFGGEITTLPLELSKFQATYNQLFGNGSGDTGRSANEAIYVAGTLLSILPLLVMYFFTQKYFADGIDKAGITGE